MKTTGLKKVGKAMLAGLKQHQYYHGSITKSGARRCTIKGYDFCLEDYSATDAKITFAMHSNVLDARYSYELTKNNGYFALSIEKEHHEPTGRCVYLYSEESLLEFMVGHIKNEKQMC